MLTHSFCFLFLLGGSGECHVLSRTVSALAAELDAAKEAGIKEAQATVEAQIEQATDEVREQRSRSVCC